MLNLPCVRDDVAVHDRPAAPGREAALDQARGVQRPEFSERLRAQALGDPDPVRLCGAQGLHILTGSRGRPGGAEGPAALGDGAAEKARCERRCAEHADRDTAGGFAEDRDPVRVAAESADVVLDPAQGGNLVKQAIVSRDAVGVFGAQFRMRKESDLAYAVSRADHDHAFAGKFAPVRDRVGRSTARKAPAIDPDHHRKLVLGGFGRRPDVQIKAVLAVTIRVVAALHRAGSIVLSLPDPLPGIHGLRGFPPEVTDRRSREGDTLVYSHILLDFSLDPSAFHPDHSRLIAAGAASGQQQRRDGGRNR